MSAFGKNKKNNQADLIVNKKTLHKNLDFTAIEQYKLLRTNIRFTLTEDVKCPIIGVTSSMRGEGKSTTSVNLSYVLAESGSRVLLIDGDLRIPSVAKKMNIDSEPGLTDMLLDKDMDLEQFASPDKANWYIMPSGKIPPNPSELLGSARMKDVFEKLREHFDYIVIDLPPVNLVSDAIAVSRFISGMIVVIRQGYAERKELDHCMKQLELSEVNVLGCVMTYAGGHNGSYAKYKKYKYYNSDKGDES